MELKFKKLLPDAILPAGRDRDIHSLIEYEIEPGDLVSIPTGLSVNVPDGHLLVIADKRSNVEIHQIKILNAPGLIHPGSNIEIKVLLKNESIIPFKVMEGMAIGQVFLMPIQQFEPVFIE